MHNSPLTPSSTRTLLESLGHHPRKRLGQNFLIDGNIVRKSLQLANVEAGDIVAEVGPGLGTLTRALLEAGAQVFAVELDTCLHSYLDQQLRGELSEDADKRFSLLHGDAVDYPLGKLTEAFQQLPEYKIVANLPYAVSTPWLESVIQLHIPERMVLMLQKEAADRYTAAPGSKSYGAISIFVQSALDRNPGHAVSRQSFYPVPGVDSVLLNLQKKANPFVFPKEDAELIRQVFQQRRKQIGGLCRGKAKLERWLEKAAIAPSIRPEDIPVAQWQLMTEV
ncbi:MAG: ribosomal RNA small subunit methyltransferase A [Opitutales bacterium]|nr:ribosomal RNA small subunit methyltransferase A [Opitutales bacterium]